MQTEEQTIEELKKFLGETQEKPAKESTPEEIAMFYINKALESLQRGKPEDRSEVARRYAVTITEMEKVFSYFKTFVFDCVVTKE